MADSNVPLLTAILLDSSGTEPLYQQLYDSIRNSILSGELTPGFRCPSSRVLAHELGVSRTTVKNAYEQLTAEGYLVGTVGSGTRVSRALPERQLQVSASSLGSKSNSVHATQLSKRSTDLRRRAQSHRTPLSDGLPFEPGLPALDEFPHHAWNRLQAKHL